MHKTYDFAGYTLDLTRGCLRAGDRVLELRPKSFAVLAYLVENAGRLVPKEELLDAVWPAVTVGDEFLAKCISEIRAALDDGAQHLVGPYRGEDIFSMCRSCQAVPGQCRSNWNRLSFRPALDPPRRCTPIICQNRGPAPRPSRLVLR